MNTTRMAAGALLLTAAALLAGWTLKGVATECRAASPIVGTPTSEVQIAAIPWLD